MEFSLYGMGFNVLFSTIEERLNYYEARLEEAIKLSLKQKEKEALIYRINLRIQKLNEMKIRQKLKEDQATLTGWVEDWRNLRR
jgi:hypothetical protein